MIDTKELRIGNWYNNGYANYTLGTSDFIDHLNEAQVKEGKIELIFPIPLTSDILEGCGFEKTGEIWEGTAPPSHLFQIKFLWKNKTPFIRAKFFDLNWHSGIQSIHQLQNLYFILSGEELKINLNVETHQ